MTKKKKQKKRVQCLGTYNGITYMVEFNNITNINEIIPNAITSISLTSGKQFTYILDKQ